MQRRPFYLPIYLMLAAAVGAIAFCETMGGAGAPSGAAGSESADAHIQSVTAITKIFADGMKVSAIAVKYDKEISGASISPSSYTVKTDVAGQKITGVYTSADGDYFTKSGKAGQYVVLELSTDYIIPVPLHASGPSSAPGQGPGGANAPSGQAQGGPGGASGQQSSPGGEGAPGAASATKVVLPPNAELVTKVGEISWDPAAHPASLLPTGHGGNGKVVSVAQIGSITAVDGTTITASSGAKENESIRNFVVDGFMKPDYHDATNGNVKYNIHFPRDYDPNKKYPVVVFLTDQNDSGSTHADSLIHANGGTIWAEKDEEARNEAIVVVPNSLSILVNDNYQPALDVRPGPQAGQGASGGAQAGGAPNGVPAGQGGPQAGQNGPTSAQTGQAPRSNQSNPYLATLNLMDYLLKQVPSIDTKRIYLTGQGDGARAGIKMMIDRPELFAAALLFAPDYDPAQMAKLSKANLWIVASEEDSAVYTKIANSIDSLKTAGAEVSRATWSGQSTSAEFAADVRGMISQGGNIKFAVLEKRTTLPLGVENNALNAHAYTWRIGYSIQGLRDWLFTQKK